MHSTINNLLDSKLFAKQAKKKTTDSQHCSNQIWPSSQARTHSLTRALKHAWRPSQAAVSGSIAVLQPCLQEDRVMQHENFEDKRVTILCTCPHVGTWQPVRCKLNRVRCKLNRVTYDWSGRWVWPVWVTQTAKTLEAKYFSAFVQVYIIVKGVELVEVVGWSRQPLVDHNQVALPLSFQKHAESFPPPQVY